jgi:hypothetical protein
VIANGFPQRILLVALFPALLLAPGTARATGGIILNTLQGFSEGTPGWSGNVDGLYSGSGGNTERLIFAVTSGLQWRGERNRWLLRGGWGYEESNGLRTAENVIVHLRHNYDLTSSLATIAFVQVQESPFQDIASRWLLGVGLRDEIVNTDSTKVIVGATPMFEVQRLEGQERTEDMRLSTFLLLSRYVARRVRLDATGFYQPLFDDFRNYRTVGTLTMVIGVTGSLDFKMGGSVETNSRPAPGVERTDWSTFTSLALSL